MKVSLLSEGDIDLVLLPSIIREIARQNGVNWPLNVDEDQHIAHIRKTGHGAVLKKLAVIIGDYQKGRYVKPDMLIVVLDHRKTQMVVDELRRLVQGCDWTVIGVAREEVEAWWLADRKQTLGWLGLSEEAAVAADYGPDYAPEKDEYPKRTLNRLTDCSHAVDSLYGDGSVALAESFVLSAWNQYVDLDSLRVKCPKGFAPFQADVSRRVRASIKKAARS